MVPGPQRGRPPACLEVTAGSVPVGPGAWTSPRVPLSAVEDSPGPVRLLVVIVNYRLADKIEDLLRRCPFDGARVVLVDNGSQPERLQAIAREQRSDLMLLDRNYGFAAAVNRAVASVPEHDAVLLLNPDVDLTPAVLAALWEGMAGRELTGVSPLLRNQDGTVQVGTAGGRANATAFVAYFLGISHILPRLGGVFYTRKQLRSGVPPSWLCMACLLLDGRAFRTFGPIPEQELAYAEDLAWGVAATRAGARFAVLPGVEVVHEQGAAGGGFLWREALVRLARRENGQWGGRVAVASVTVGLAVRSSARAVAARAGR